MRNFFRQQYKGALKTKPTQGGNVRTFLEVIEDFNRLTHAPNGKMLADNSSKSQL